MVGKVLVAAGFVQCAIIFAGQPAPGAGEAISPGPSDQYQFNPCLSNQLLRVGVDEDCLTATICIRSYRDVPVYLSKPRLEFDLLQCIRFWRDGFDDVFIIEQPISSCVLFDDPIEGEFHAVTRKSPLILDLQWQFNSSVLRLERKSDFEDHDKLGTPVSRLPEGRYFVDVLGYLQVYDRPPANLREVASHGSYNWVPPQGGRWLNIASSNISAALTSDDRPALWIHQHPAVRTQGTNADAGPVEVYIWRDGMLVSIYQVNEYTRSAKLSRVSEDAVDATLSALRTAGFLSDKSRVCAAPCSQINWVGAELENERRVFGWDRIHREDDGAIEANWKKYHEIITRLTRTSRRISLDMNDVSHAQITDDIRQVSAERKRDSDVDEISRRRCEIAIQAPQKWIIPE